MCTSSEMSCGMEYPHTATRQNGGHSSSDMKRVVRRSGPPKRNGAYFNSKEPRMPMKPVLDEFVSAGDLRFHFVQWGEHGDPIVCITGITANAFCFQAFGEGLARDHRIIAYDLRGRGDSTKPEHGYSVAIHADDLAKLIDAWGLERPIVLGHSLGAFIGLYFAAHYPEKLSKLILVDAGANSPW